MTSTGPTWNPEPEKFTGDIGVAVSVSREGWERFDAPFAEIDDELGGTAWIAAGVIDTSIGGAEFGVLDYGAETTYLLVPATGEENRLLTSAVVDALVGAEILSPENVLDGDSPFEKEEGDLAQRVAVLEQLMGETAAEAPSTAIPVAVDVEIPTRYPDAPPKEPGFYVRVFRYRKGGSRVNLNRHVGTIESLNRDKGFGVIRPVDGGKEVLLKITDVPAGVELGDIGKKVTFRYGIEPVSPDEPEDDSEAQTIYVSPPTEKR